MEADIRQHGQVGIAGAEIIQGKLEPVFLELVDHRRECVVFKISCRLCDLHLHLIQGNLRILAENRQKRRQRRGIQQGFPRKIR